MSTEGKPWEINCNRALIIPDIHQDINWVKSILEIEKGNYDHLHFNGDIIDSYDAYPKVASIYETVQFYRWLLDNGTVNLGNHELPIMESYFYNQKYTSKHSLQTRCSGFTNSKSIDFNREMTWPAWRKAKTFYVINGWLVSHAGFHGKLWRQEDNIDFNLKELWNSSEECLEKFPYVYTDWLFGVGSSRNGTQPRGGPFWQDFRDEFDDELPIKQLVGHTPSSKEVQHKKKSYCIDGRQTVYALIEKNGDISFKGIYNNIPFIPTTI